MYTRSPPRSSVIVWTKWLHPRKGWGSVVSMHKTEPDSMKRPPGSPGRPTLADHERRVRRDFRLPPGINARLKEAATSAGVDETRIVVTALDRELKRMERAKAAE